VSKHVVSVGDLVLDILMAVRLPLQAGEHQTARERIIGPGGAGNFIVAARHMGLDVSAVGIVGEDIFGQQILEPLHAAGVDTTFVAAVPGSTSTLVLVMVEPNTGKHVFVGDYGHGPVAPYPAGLDARIASADAIFVQGYTLYEQRMIPLARLAVERAREVGTPVYLDVGPFMAWMQPDDVRWIVARAAVIMATEDELPLASGGRTGDAAIRYLLDAGAELLVVKRGEQGCVIHTRAESMHVPGFAVPVVDTVGAGDCFDAAFVAGHLYGLELRLCGRLANAMGAAVVGRLGAGANAPSRDDVLALLREAGEEVTLP